MNSKPGQNLLGSLRVAIIGVGLIGGSLAKALRQSGSVARVVGYARRKSVAERALQLGVVDEYSTDLTTVVAGADLVVIATPVLSTRSILEHIKPALAAHTIVTDVGSAKGVVVEACEQVFGRVPAKFVLGHPIAGSERSGVEAADAGLFNEHKVILTPLADSDAHAVAVVTDMWRAVGAEVLEMDVAHHDQVLASTSHLPHLLAYSLVDTLAHQDANQDIFRYAAGGFRDFTRIASSDPTMWHDIMLANHTAVLASLDQFQADLGRLREALEQKDSQQLMGVFSRAKAARDHFIKRLDSSSYMNAEVTGEVTFEAMGGGPLAGQLRVPGDKSISHRSIMLGAIAEGITEIEGFLEGEDSLATLQAFRDMGVVIEGPQDGRVLVHGVGLHGLQAPVDSVYLGNSGTSMRLLAGLLSSHSFAVELTGDDSLSGRPMERVAKPLRSMGAQIESRDGKPPLGLAGGSALTGIEYELPVASAQIKSSILLAGLYAQGETCVIEDAPTRDHTERMLRGFSYPVTSTEISSVQRRICLSGGGVLKATQIDVPADISSAAFFMVAASITPGSDIVLEHVGVNPTRIGVINILRAMGGDLTLVNEREAGGEPVADIRVRYAPLKGIDIPVDQVPLAIDEFPVLFVAAACAEGVTRLTDAAELRVKESDRIQVMADGLITLGVTAQPTDDGIVIQQSTIGEGSVASHGDHRIAMAFAVASLRATGPIEISDCANVATSFPNFIGLAAKVGLTINIKQQ